MRRFQQGGGPRAARVNAALTAQVLRDEMAGQQAASAAVTVKIRAALGTRKALSAEASR